MEPQKITVIMNGNIDKSCEVLVHKNKTLNDLVSECKDKLRIAHHVKCKMFDSAGGELSDDDVEYMNEDEPIFISLGEDFLKRSSLAIYNLKSTLGEGGFGSVNLYEHKLTKHLVAIKFVDLSTIVSPEDVNRVYSEIGVLRGLKHPNIVHLIDTFDSEGKICFVMEYCSGGELKEFIETRFPISEDQVYDLACQIAEAIRFCHNSKVIHRDLKLENILFASKTSNQIKIVDFGISGMSAGAGGGGGGERSDAGSLLYIAPEVLSGLDNRANPALDVWSMGCIFYALLMKDLPFMGETQDEVIKKILKGDYPHLDAKISKPWHKLIKGMIRIQANKRWNMNRITEHLFKFKYDPDASLSEESEQEVEEVKTNIKKKEAPRIQTKLNKSPVKSDLRNKAKQPSKSPLISKSPIKPVGIDRKKK